MGDICRQQMASHEEVIHKCHAYVASKDKQVMTLGKLFQPESLTILAVFHKIFNLSNMSRNGEQLFVLVTDNLAVQQVKQG